MFCVEVWIGQRKCRGRQHLRMTGSALVAGVSGKYWSAKGVSQRALIRDYPEDACCL